MRSTGVNLYVVFSAIVFWVIANLMIGMLNSIGPDCKLRYADFIFPGRRLPCEVTK